jgi:hypothetical protein
MITDRTEMAHLRGDNESKSTQLEEAKRKISELSSLVKILSFSFLPLLEISRSDIIPIWYGMVMI